ncbi:hypothetical protein P7H22_24815 [Paenibacillus larvae]|nr:hypothetical protein [Paenibacillus larvae]MDT2242908.1 hypothetical protein [Paenibacillus larvae]
MTVLPDNLSRVCPNGILPLTYWRKILRAKEIFYSAYLVEPFPPGEYFCHAEYIDGLIDAIQIKSHFPNQLVLFLAKISRLQKADVHQR